MTETEIVQEPPYYWKDKWGNGYWSPSKVMRAAGFKNVSCGPHGIVAIAKANAWYQKWLQHKISGTVLEQQPSWPAGSVGEAFTRFRATAEWKRKPARTREDWDRGWRYIAPHFGDVKPTDITFEGISIWYSGDPDDAESKGLLGKHTVREAHRAVKIWRALWRVMAAMKYCKRDEDPSLGVRRVNPSARSAVWSEGEVVRLAKAALRMGYAGAACIIGVSWDTQFSPVDVRTLRMRHFKRDAGRIIFDRSEGRTKTAYKQEGVIGTLSPRTERLVLSYLAARFGNSDVHPDTILFCTRGGVPVSRDGNGGGRGGDRGGGRPSPPTAYTKDTLTRDVRKIRCAAFGMDEDRKLMDFRRSASIEAVAGEVDPAALASKMGNSIDESRDLQRTYLPGQVAVVRSVDDARRAGRQKLRKS